MAIAPLNIHRTAAVALAQSSAAAAAPGYTGIEDSLEPMPVARDELVVGPAELGNMNMAIAGEQM